MTSSLNDSSKNYTSIFNDVISPVMRGLSSFHCAAVVRIGLMIRDLMDGEIDAGIAGTEYVDRILGYQSGNFQSQMENRRLIDGCVLNRIILYTIALMESKSSSHLKRIGA